MALSLIIFPIEDALEPTEALFACGPQNRGDMIPVGKILLLNCFIHIAFSASPR
jgi:hypothetical protein